jgi:hypothetical protein
MILAITLDHMKLKQYYRLILVVQFPYAGSESTVDDTENAKGS